MYIPRLHRPEQGNKYYIRQESGGFAVGVLTGNPTDKWCDVLSNCVGYAAARFNEILGKGEWVYLKCAPMPYDFIKRAESEGLSTGYEPKLGAIIVWKTHVAVVEQINDDGSITTSESGWGNKIPFWTQKRMKGNGNWGTANFLGFIYQPERSEHMKGIDVSVYQGEIDWKKVRADNVDFAIIRAGLGKLVSQADKNFMKNYDGAKSAGIKVGAYWYSYAMSEDEARQEAKAFIQVISGLCFEFPVWLDLEEQKQFDLGKEKVSAIVRAFLEEVEKAGYFVGLYSSYSALQTHIASDIQNRYAIWCAHWCDSTPYKLWGIWQHSCKGSVNGITGDVDMDVCRTDYPTRIMKKGLNGYRKDSAEPQIEIKTDAESTIDVSVAIGGVTYKGKLTKI